LRTATSSRWFGFAGGSYQNKQTENGRLPAAWKAIVKDGRVSSRQVFAETKIPFEIIEHNSQVSRYGKKSGYVGECSPT
jgi:hypothetical protein